MAGPAAIPASAEEVHARIDQLAGELAGAPEGSGNNEATRIGFMVGGYVGAGQIPFDQACGRLEAALATWTWRDDTSRTGVHMSLQRALDDGAKAPRPWTAAQPATKAKVKKPPPAPGTPGSYFTDSGGLLVATLAGAIRAKHPCALTQEHKVAVYTGGCTGSTGWPRPPRSPNCCRTGSPPSIGHPSQSSSPAPSTPRAGSCPCTSPRPS